MPEVGRSPGAEDAAPSGTSDALEAPGVGGAEVLEGVGRVDGGGLGAGTAPPGIRPREAGRRLPWMMVQEPAREGSPLPPLEPGPMEVDGAEQAPGDGGAAEEAEDS